MQMQKNQLEKQAMRKSTCALGPMVPLEVTAASWGLGPIPDSDSGLRVRTRKALRTSEFQNPFDLHLHRGAMLSGLHELELETHSRVRAICF